MALFPLTPPALGALAILIGGLALAVVRRYPIAYTMALLCIGVYALQAVSGMVVRCRLGGIVDDCVLAELSFIAPLTWEGDRPLTPFTYMFVHADLLHLAGNMFILLTAGPALEERIGSRNFLLIYLAAGLGAAGASVGLWQLGFFTGGQEFSPNVGASGAIFGVLTAFATLFPREKLPMILPFMFFVFWMPALTVLLLHIAINVAFAMDAFGATNVAWWGHFGGSLVGLTLVPLLRRTVPARLTQLGPQVDLSALEPLATTTGQKTALKELQRLADPKTRDDHLLAKLWWDRFLQGSRCPVCNHHLQLEGVTLRCSQNHFSVRALLRPFAY